MRKHHRAADLLYRGLVVPSTHSWNLGADALTGDPVELDLKRESTPQPEIEALAQRLHDLAQQARKAEDSKARSELYGQMLATCSECHVGVEPVPNYTRDVKQGIARWDAYLHVPDPDALAAEFSSRNVEFSEPLEDTSDGLRGFELKDADGYVLFFGRPRS
jgi:hypothetical protein